MKIIRVIDALRLPEVLNGSKWMAFILPYGMTLPQQTLAVFEGRLRWCDREWQAGAVRPSYFGEEALLSFKRLHEECLLIDAKKAP